ncbi:hypothetical protein [Planctopirus hydrillae]|uniref:Uncharacterized protein n=1 Tax=Planctopirus hydrillae TaxID=1841610 RepID=A0A1C3E4I7_9PLAN|nr:hypothetical protein [Planctopirus hydrillae]ODA28079.1 hypothetical protein A6X21_14555 [Planctopirus hydrillae]
MAAVFSFGVRDEVGPGLAEMGQRIEQVGQTAHQTTQEQQELTRSVAQLAKQMEEAAPRQRSWAGAIADQAENLVLFRFGVNGSREALQAYNKITQETSGPERLARVTRSSELAIRAVGNASQSTARDLVQMTRTAEPLARLLENVEARLGRTSQAAGSFRRWAAGEGAELASRRLATQGGATLAGRAAGAVFTGARLATSTFAVGAAASVQAQRALFANTGIQQVGETQDFSRSTEAQKEAFAALERQAKKTGQTVAELMQEAGQTWDDFGAQTVPVFESNLDRMEASVAKLKSSVGRDLQGIGTALVEMADRAIPVRSAFVAIGKEIDASATRGANNWVQNMDLLDQLKNQILEVAADYDQILVGEGQSLDNYRERAKLLKEQEEMHARLDVQREKERGHFDRLRAAHEAVEMQVKAAQESRRIASLQTVEQIDAEIRRQRELAGQRATALQFDAQAQQAHTQLLMRLEQQKADAQARIIEQQQEAQRVYREDQARFEREREEEYNAHLQRVVDASKKRYDEEMAYRDQVYNEARQTAVEQLENQQNAALEMMRAEGASTKELAQQRIRLLEEERDRNLSFAKTREERLKAEHEFQRKLSRETTSYAVAAHREEVEAAKEAEEKKRQAMEETANRRRQLAGEGLQKAGIDGQRLLQNQDPRAVTKQLQTRAGVLAAQKFDRANRGTMAHGTAQEKARLNARRKKVIQAAQRDAFRQERMGKTDPQQRIAAQRDLAKSQIDAMKDTGQLAKEQIEVLEEQLNAAVQTQQTVEALQQRLDQLAETSNQLNRNAAAQRQRAQRGSIK